MTRALFICGKARMRSPTAADIVADWESVQSDFAGVSHDADEKISSEHIEWADVIYVMESRQKKRLLALFGPLLKAKRVVNLAIPDVYSYMQPELVTLLTQKLRSLR